MADKPPSPFKRKPAALPSPVPPTGARAGAPRRRSAARGAARLGTLSRRLTANLGRLAAVVASLKSGGRTPPASEIARILARLQRDYGRALGEKSVLAEGEQAKRQAAGQLVVRHLVGAGVDFGAALELVRRGAAAGDVVKALAPRPPRGHPGGAAPVL